MNEHKCKECTHYIQHYGLNEGKLYRIYCGHCTLHKPKNRRPDAKACENFAPGAPDTDAFADKKYLSKALVEYMCSLELLPSIREDEKEK